MKSYDHKKIEKKWQKEWEKKKLYEVKNGVKGKKFYGLIEFPYPSGAGLHVGHIRSNTAMDIISRKRRMEGYNVLYPIGWDAFGLPTENYAIKTGKQPEKVTKENTDMFRKQLKAVGFSFDWSREVNTTDPAYFKWTQWIFLQMYKKGLAYKSKTTINWCPKDKIGLANEEVVNGKCDRCEGPVEKREKEQWMLAITKYADRLDKDLDDVNYLEKIKIQQRNWIGKSEGSEIDFPIANPKTKRIVILHGKGGSPETDFIPWLKENLKKKGFEVFVPTLPNASTPDDSEQADCVIKNVPIDENTVIVGHSFGGIVAMRILERGIKVHGVIFAGTPVLGKFKDGKDRPSVKAAIDKGFDYEKIKKYADYFKVLSDTTDPIVSNEDGETLAQNLNTLNQKVSALKEHFCGKQEPSILEAVLPQVKVFTTRADTLFGAYALILAPEHPVVQVRKNSAENKIEIEQYLKNVKNKTDIERTDDGKEKTGVEIKGLKVINPINGEAIPVWTADFVLVQYGTGAIFADMHDERDFAFAKKYNLSMREVLVPENLNGKVECFTGEGILINSGEYSGMLSQDARKKITEAVGGKIVTKYKLRDWVFSRQRYWGEPIPLIKCEKCEWVPVPDKDLPVTLPKVKSYQPTDNGESPLAVMDKWVNVKCPQCKGPAKRETDTMPNWAGSSWYFLRYTDPKNKKEFASKKNLKYFTPVDWYNGGMEHTTLHLLYSRFWHKFLYDLKLVPTKEPYMKRTSHGMILAEGGEKMSKSKGNTVDPKDIIESFGADTLRLYEMFIGPFDQAVSWSSEGIVGPRRFIEKVWRIGEKVAAQKQKNFSRFTQKGEPYAIKNSSPFTTLLHKTIKKVSEDIENMSFNTAVSSMMVLTNEMDKMEYVNEKDFKMFLQILSPFVPHVTDELWNVLDEKKSIHISKWPKYDPKKIVEENIKIVIQVNSKVRAEMTIGKDMTEDEVKEKALKEKGIASWTAGKEIKRVIYVKDRLVNIVVG